MQRNCSWRIHVISFQVHLISFHFFSLSFLHMLLQYLSHQRCYPPPLRRPQDELCLHAVNHLDLLLESNVTTGGHPVIMFCDSPQLLNPPKLCLLTAGTKGRKTVFSVEEMLRGSRKWYSTMPPQGFPGVLGQGRLYFQKC